ncbi:MAG TPA: terminase small subunit [Longimicrobiaceae bacterium]
MASRVLTSSQKELADLFGVSRETIRQWVLEGMPTRTVSGQTRYVARECVQWRRDRDREAGRPDSPVEAEERARKLRADADLAELRLAERRRQLVPAAEVEHEWDRICSVLRSRILAVRGRWAPRVLGLGTMPEATGVLDDLTRDLLSVLAAAADEVEAGDEAEDDAA